MKTKLLTIAMTAVLMLTAMTKVQAQNYEGPCLPSMHGLDDHQSAFCGSTLTQTIALSAGTNWFSTYVEITLDDLKAALVDVYPSSEIFIKSKTQTHTYNPNNHRWTGRFDELDLSRMYIIKVAQAGEITLEGMPVDPTQHEVTVTPGSTYIAFPLSQSMTPGEAFAGFAVQGDKLKSKSATSAYNRGKWGNQIPTLEPGKGYIYISEEATDRVFTFPTNSK